VKRLATAAAAAIFAFLPLAGAVALDAPVAIRSTWGVDVESLLDPGLASRVASPSINFEFGAGAVFPLRWNRYLSFEPSADLYFYNTEYSVEGQSVPTAEEDASAFTLGLLLDAPLVFSLPLGSQVTLGAGLGLGLDLRAAITLDSSYLAQNTPLMNQYYWDKGRFLTPSTLLRGEYKLTDRTAFGFTGRVYWPIYNLWTKEGFGFLDQTMYFIDLTILFKLGAGGGLAAGSAQPPPDAPTLPGSAPSPAPAPSP
jgi:hypothetical protein